MVDADVVECRVAVNAREPVAVAHVAEKCVAVTSVALQGLTASERQVVEIAPAVGARHHVRRQQLRDAQRRRGGCRTGADVRQARRRCSGTGDASRGGSCSVGDAKCKLQLVSPGPTSLRDGAPLVHDARARCRDGATEGPARAPNLAHTPAGTRSQAWTGERSRCCMAAVPFWARAHAAHAKTSCEPKYVRTINI